MENRERSGSVRKVGSGSALRKTGCTALVLMLFRAIQKMKFCPEDKASTVCRIGVAPSS
jgi:hypothetical protein